MRIDDTAFNDIIHYNAASRGVVIFYMDVKNSLSNGHFGAVCGFVRNRFEEREF